MKKGTIRQLHDYFFGTKEFDADIKRAIAEFFETEFCPGATLKFEDKEEELFLEWFAFDFRLSTGEKLFEYFFNHNPLNLSKNDLAVYESLQFNKYSLFKVLKVDSKGFLKIGNIFSNKIYEVVEKRAAQELEEGDTITGRVGKIGDHFELVGSSSIMIPECDIIKIKKIVEEEKQEFNPKLMRKFWRKSMDEWRDPYSEVNTKRTEIEKDLRDLLKKHQSQFSLDDIKTIIYYEKDNDDMMEIVQIFDRGKPDELQPILDLITDAWNYFPHKSLDGLSPMEKLNQTKEEDK